MEKSWLRLKKRVRRNTYTDGDIKDLTEAAANITTFTQKADDKSTATADQVFYLGAAAPTAPATTLEITYKKLAPTTIDELTEAKKLRMLKFMRLQSQR